MTEGWFHTQSLTNNEIYGKARQRDDASIVPYKLFAAFITIGKVSLRRDEGIPPYRDNIPFGVYMKKAELLTALLLHFMGISYFMPCSCSFPRTAPTPR